VKIYFDKFPDFLFEIFCFLLHVESSPINTLDILEPFISYQLIPHGKRYSSSRIGLKDAKPIFLISKNYSNMVAF
jgi:hypothetical protein